MRTVEIKLGRVDEDFGHMGCRISHLAESIKEFSEEAYVNYLCNIGNIDQNAVDINTSFTWDETVQGFEYWDKQCEDFNAWFYEKHSTYPRRYFVEFGC